MICPVTRERTATRVGNRLLGTAEGVVYVGIAGFLVLAAMALLVLAAVEMLRLFTEFGSGQEVVLEVLDILLLVFIVVELLYAVRMTIAKRSLVAEPFLLVGIIASIKEIVVLSVKAADNLGQGDVFTDSLLEIAVLGGLVLLLGVTAWLLRIKEREPEEAENTENPEDAEAPDGEAPA